MTYFLTACIVCLVAACCRLAQLLGRERAATAELRWKLLGYRLREDLRLSAGKREEEWPEQING